MRPPLHFAASDFNAARKHAKDHGNGLIKYVLVDRKGKKTTRYYSGNALPKHIKARALTVEEKQV